MFNIVAWGILLLKYIYLYGYICDSHLNVYCLNKEAHFECDTSCLSQDKTNHDLNAYAVLLWWQPQMIKFRERKKYRTHNTGKTVRLALKKNMTLICFFILEQTKFYLLCCLSALKDRILVCSVSKEMVTCFPA